MRQTPICSLSFAAMLVTGALVVAPPASASYPGSNGLIAYDRYAGAGSDIFVVNPDGTFATNLTRTSGVFEFDPSFSPDGTKIAFDAFVGDTLSDVYMMNVDGSFRVQLTNTPTVGEAFPAFSPDGTRIAFVRSQEDGSDLWVMNADGTQPVALTSSGDVAYSRLSWRPDGSVIVFARLKQPSFEFDLYTIDIATGTQTQLTSQAGDEFQPDYSPDGSRIAFHRFVIDGGVNEARVMSADGTGSVAVGGGGEQIYSTWAPDGMGILVLQYNRGSPALKLYDVADGTSTLVMREAAGQLSWQPCRSTCVLDQPAPSEVNVYNYGGRDSTRVEVEVIPYHVGSEVSVTLYRRTDGSFRKIGSQVATVGRRGTARADFPKFTSGRCKAVATFAGDADHTGSTGRLRFRCKGFSVG